MQAQRIKVSFPRSEWESLDIAQYFITGCLIQGNEGEIFVAIIEDRVVVTDDLSFERWLIEEIEVAPEVYTAARQYLAARAQLQCLALRHVAPRYVESMPDETITMFIGRNAA